MQTLDIPITEEVYTVSRLNREVKMVLEGSFPLLWVEGEISNFSAPYSGHWYFCLKEANAQVKCAMFKMSNRKLKFTPKDGMHVLVRARVSLYEGRGDFQLIVDDIEERGAGKLQRAFEELKKQLQAKGLFASEHKKPLPKLPSSIGIITSATGAALRDILNVLNRRFPCVGIIIYPTLVQGETAAPNIVKAIQIADKRKECDVLILARGGGSLEDLWPFNEAMVAHAIYDCSLPIISGIGHEIDFTIADFVADVRAPTPSAAAELVVPAIIDLLQTLQQSEQRFLRLIIKKINHSKQNVSWAEKHLVQQHPKKRLAEKAQRLDFLEMNLVRLEHRLLAALQAKIKTLSANWLGLTPLHRIRMLSHQNEVQEQQLQKALIKLIQEQKLRLSNLAGKLDTLSPLATLERGYAIALRTSDQHVLRASTETKVGEEITVRLMQGSLGCVVKKVEE